MTKPKISFPKYNPKLGLEAYLKGRSTKPHIRDAEILLAALKAEDGYAAFYVSEKIHKELRAWVRKNQPSVELVDFIDITTTKL